MQTKTSTHWYKKNFNALVLCIHGGDPDTLLTGFIDLHLGPELGI